MKRIAATRIFEALILSLVTMLMPSFAYGAEKFTSKYVGSKQCASCHEKQASAWDKSHHQLAWTHPVAKNILGDFKDSKFSHHGVTTKFTTKKDKFYIETDGPDGALKKFEVKGVVGIEPLQQYLLETVPGKLQSFDVTWDTEKKHWYHLYPKQNLPAKNGLHWTGPYKSWNARCAECHATGYEKNYNPVTKLYQSRQAEIGVGCEACHGPGKAHLEWAKKPNSIAKKSPNLTPFGFNRSFSSTTQHAEIRQCAACHSRREAFFDRSFPVSRPFDDGYQLSMLRDGLYFSDGQSQGEVYVLGSFMQSKMFAKGVTCSNCHDVHSTKLKSVGNGLCTQCHSQAGNAGFASLTRKNYDDPTHHFHKAGSAGAQCKNCHMAERTYMGVDKRSDHSFRIPRPDLSVKIGAPNTCNNCHNDKTAKWADDAILKWYPDSTNRGAHFSETFHTARKSGSTNIKELLAIADNTDLPGIVRASALDMLVRVTSKELAAQTTKYLNDPDPLVRASAATTQRGSTDVEKIKLLVPMAKDKSRSVRLAVAKEMLALFVLQPKKTIPESLKFTMQEFRASLQTKADFPETQLVMGGLGLTARSIQAALNAFQEAVRQDPQLLDAWIIILRIQLSIGDIESAKLTIKKAIEANPDQVVLRNFEKQINGG